MDVSKLVSPFCLLLAMLMLVVAFVVVASDAPTESVQLHQARAVGDELMENALKDRLLGQIWFRRFLLAGLFCGSILMAIVAFVSMRGRS